MRHRPVLAAILLFALATRVAYLLWFDQLTALTTQFAFLNEFVFGLEEAISGLLGISNTTGTLATSSP